MGPELEEELEQALPPLEITYAPCKECATMTADICAACENPLHFECGSVRDEEIVSFCESCCLELGDVENVPGRMARRMEMIARIAPIYGLSVTDFF